MIPVTERMDQYLAQRKAFGTGLSRTTERVLRKFAAFVVDQGAEHVTTELFLRWKGQYESVSQQTWASRLGYVRTFARWLQTLEPATEVPPCGLFPQNRKRSRPYIYTDDEIGRIIEAATGLTSPYGLRGPTYATLFGLLSVTGLRIGEAVGLDDGDVDTGECLLHIRKAKYGKFRVVPVAPCTAARLEEYRSLRHRILGPLDTPAFFAGENRRRISGQKADNTFALISQEIGLREKQPPERNGKGPRIHDLRHTVAVRTLIGWYRKGLDPDREMYKLTTWLGHDRPVYTYWYLEAVPELLQLATERAERAFPQGGYHDEA